MKFLKQATYVRYVIGKLSKSIQVSTHIFHFTEDSLKIKKSMELVSGHIFHFFCNITKIGRFRYQTVFTFQVIQ